MFPLHSTQIAPDNSIFPFDMSRQSDLLVSVSCKVDVGGICEPLLGLRRSMIQHLLIPAVHHFCAFLTLHTQDQFVGRPEIPGFPVCRKNEFSKMIFHEIVSHACLFIFTPGAMKTNGNCLTPPTSEHLIAISDCYPAHGRLSLPFLRGCLTKHPPSSKANEILALLLLYGARESQRSLHRMWRLHVGGVL